MKKNIIIIVVTAIFFLILGIFIGRNINTEKKDSNIEVNEQENIDSKIEENNDFKLQDSWTKTENFKCVKMTEAIDLDPSNKLFITKDNELYMYSTDKIFSNGENCKKIETDIKFQKFIKNIIVDVDNNLYKIKDESVEKINVPSKNASDSDKIDFSIAVNGPSQLQSLNEKDYKNMSYINYDFRKYFYFYLKDNNVYNYNVRYNESDETIMDSNYTLSDNKLVELEENEQIEFFIDGTIKTNKGYYLFENKVINKEESEKYADVKPEYKVGFYKIENEKITNQKDKIAFLKEMVDTASRSIYIVTTDGELIFIYQN